MHRLPAARAKAKAEASRSTPSASNRSQRFSVPRLALLALPSLGITPLITRSPSGYRNTLYLEPRFPLRYHLFRLHACSSQTRPIAILRVGRVCSSGRHGRGALAGPRRARLGPAPQRSAGSGVGRLDDLGQGAVPDLRWPAQLTIVLREAEHLVLHAREGVPARALRVGRVLGEARQLARRRRDSRQQRERGAPDGCAVRISIRPRVEDAKSPAREQTGEVVRRVPRPLRRPRLRTIRARRAASPAYALTSVSTWTMPAIGPVVMRRTIDRPDRRTWHPPREAACAKI